MQQQITLASGTLTSDTDIIEMTLLDSPEVKEFFYQSRLERIVRRISRRIANKIWRRKIILQIRDTETRRATTDCDNLFLTFNEGENNG